MYHSALESAVMRVTQVACTGASGKHKIELIYANYSGPGLLSFSPKM